MALQLRRGTNDARSGVRFQNGELVWASDTRKLYIGDGATLGGKHVLETSAGSGLVFDSITQTIKLDVQLPSQSGNNGKFLTTNGNTLSWATVAQGGGGGIATVSADTTPALGGNLTLSGHNIQGTGNVNIVGSVTATTISAGTGLGGDLSLNGHNINGSGNINTTGEISVNLTENFAIRQVVDAIKPRGFVTTTLSRGTLLAPTAVQAGDELGGILLKGYTNSSVSAIAGLISFIVDDTAVIAGGDFIKSKIVLSAATDTTQDPTNAFILDSAGVASVNTVSVSDGNATHPSLRFGTDGGQDTGFFHPLDGVLCVSTNAVERVRVDSGGMRVIGFVKVKDFAGTLPSPPEAGMIVLDGTTFKGYNGTAWVNLN